MKSNKIIKALVSGSYERRMIQQPRKVCCRIREVYEKGQRSEIDTIMYHI